MELKEQRCPYCGGTEFTVVNNFFKVTSPYDVLHRVSTGVALYHQLCLSCGSVVRSYADREELWRICPSEKGPKGKVRRAAEKIFLVPDPEEGKKE